MVSQLVIFTMLPLGFDIATPWLVEMYQYNNASSDHDVDLL